MRFEAVGAGEDGKRAHFVGEVAEGGPKGEDVGRAAAHVDDVVVGAGEGAVWHDAQPFEVVGEAGAVEEFGEELHQLRGFDEGEKLGRVGDGLCPAEEFAALALGDDAMHEGLTGLELFCLLQVFEDSAGGPP